MSKLVLVRGDRAMPHRRAEHPALENLIRSLKAAGYTIGKTVRIGQVCGQIVGYNIGGFGRYTGEHYPLLVSTEFGIVKCAPDEVRRAA